MNRKGKPSFEFESQVSPRYIELLLMRMQPSRWYSTAQLRGILNESGLGVTGKEIVQAHTLSWTLAGLGQTMRGDSRGKLFRLTDLGRQLLSIYGTNQQLFHDLIHFIFYSTWLRSFDVTRGRFWLYMAVCNALWADAPSPIDSIRLISRLLTEARETFPEHQPGIRPQSIRAIFRWLTVLEPAFLIKSGIRTPTPFQSVRRSYCTPQLFQLASDLLYTSSGLAYGTSMSLDDQQIALISRMCLLSHQGFWEMVELTSAATPSYHIRRGQWGVSIALDAPPDWIVLPDFSRQMAAPEENSLEDEGQE